MPVNKKKRFVREIIGLIPAGGQASRISPLPCSKEIYPIGFDKTNDGRPKVSCHYLLEKMRLAGVNKAFIILREGKWDIQTYFRDGKLLGLHLAYLIMDAPFGVPFTLDQAYPFIHDNIVVFGFPDIFFESTDVFVKLLNRLSLNNCDVVLGMFPSDSPNKTDMVQTDSKGSVNKIMIKPQTTNLRYTWGMAVWTPVFTKFMHHYVEKTLLLIEQPQELFIGKVIQEAINDGLRVEAVHVSDTPYIDIGTPADLLKAVKHLTIRALKSH